MKDKEVLRNIIKEKQKKETSSQKEKEEKLRFLIFKTNSTLIAIETNDVKEISINLEIHAFPFMPEYIKGVINRYGEPFGVIDIGYINNQKSTQGNKFIITKSFSIAFIATDILGFINVKKSKLKKTEEQNTIFRYFMPYKDILIPIVDLKEIKKYIENES